MTTTAPPSLTPLALLRRLHTARHTDARIADELTMMFPLQSWTRHHVRYLRKKYGLRSWRRSPRSINAALYRTRRQKWRRVQVDAGWMHLLPAQEGKEWGPGYELCPREVAILTALHDRGPLTRLQLVQVLGLKDPDAAGGLGDGAGARLLWLWRKGRGQALNRLCRAGLVTVQVKTRLGRGIRYVYRLAPTAGRRGLSRKEHEAAGGQRRNGTT